MKLYAPSYYKDFVCIADKCTHSCCIGWEIDIDPDTAQKYSLLSAGYGEKIKSSMSSDDTPHFKLSEDERCPHLNGNGLCKIILELGEDHLCDICREHPRFYNETPYGMELGLGMCCEETARLILTSDIFSETEVISEQGAECDTELLDPRPFRREIYDIIKSDNIPYQKRLDMIYHKFGVSPAVKTDEEWKKLLASLEYLDNEHKKMFSVYSSKTDTSKNTEKELGRALAYFVYRHCAQVYYQDDLIASLGFALFCERLLASLVAAYPNESIITLSRIVSEEIEYSEDNTDAIISCFE